MKAKRVKQILALSVAAALVFGLTACGSSGGSADEGTAEAETTEDESSAAEETSEPQEEETDSAGEAAEVTEVAPFEFNISYGGSPGSSMVAVMEDLQDVMSEMSGGAFTFNAYNDNSYQESQAMDELSNDIVDITYLSSGSVCGTITELAYLGMPGCYRYTDDEEEFFDFNDSVSDIMSRIYENYGIHYLALRVPTKLAIVGTGDLPTSKEDLQGKVIRVSGTWMGRLAVSMNLSTANIDLSELATAMQRKTVDAIITGTEQVYTRMLYEVSDYACIMPEVDSIGALVIDEDCWNKLDADQQALLEKCVDQWQYNCLASSDEFYNTTIQALEDNDVDVYYYSDEECDEFFSTVPDVYEEIDAQTTDLGLELRDAILAYREVHN